MQSGALYSETTHDPLLGIFWVSSQILSYQKNLPRPPFLNWASLVAQLVKNLPAMQEAQEMWVQSLGWEDPLEESMATDSSILAWKISWTEEPGILQSIGLQRVGHD